MKSPRGVTLIMVAAVLAILSALATGFYTMMLMQTKSAVRYSDSVRADMVAKAGISYGIGQLHSQAFRTTEDAGSAWYQVDYLHGASKRVSYPDSPLVHNGIDDDGDGQVDNLEEALMDPTKMVGYSQAMGDSAGKDSDRFALNITDAAGKVNINAGDNLAVILDNLCRVIGPPLVAANLDALQPRRWAVEAIPGDPMIPLYDTAKNKNDLPGNNDIYYTLTDETNAIMTNGTGRPMRGADGAAIYGDGYAIAGYRGRHGAYRNPEDIKEALTYVERNGNNIPDDPLEQLEIEVKYAAIREHITTSSWVDTNTVCVGKFEWIHIDTSASGKMIAIDRDKSWVIDDPVKDPLNVRGSLRGSYVSIMNGHGAGQLRRIRTNGIDWIEVEGGFAVTPGPISSYMIIANEEAALMDVNGNAVSNWYPDKPPAAGTVTFPKTKPDGTLDRRRPDGKEVALDYSLHPLCIHRAPVNVNTATDKVLIALMLGINIQHGHPLALGTDTDVDLLRPGHPASEWKKDDPHNVQPYVLTPRGLKRIPASSGKPILNRSWGNGVDQVVPPVVPYDVKYLNNYDNLGGPNFVVGASPGAGLMTEAHELAYRIIMARQADKLPPLLKYIDPITGGPTSNAMGKLGPNPLRGPFRTYDDLYCRVVKPFDDARFANGTAGAVYHAAHISTLLMANFNSNTDILKFNPNIEWIDRWGRNFTEQEPLMVFTNDAPGAKPGSYYSGTAYPAAAYNGLYFQDVPPANPITAYSQPIYTAVWDSQQGNSYGGGSGPPPLTSSQTSQTKAALNTNIYTLGAYITRSFRYKSDEMVDKTDLNRSTTEFSFDSNGIFEIVSTGQVAKVGNVMAERKFSAQVKIYDVWRESTQQQFAMGTISAAIGKRDDPKDVVQLSCTGQLARDASGLVERKGLATLPEPLLPLKTRISNNVSPDTNPVVYASTKSVPNAEVVSALVTGNKDPLDAFGKPRQNPYDGASPIDVPEVLANRVLPARWDGQIVLATNTSAYDPNDDMDTFLASFDGDLDTATCVDNGREQAKWPFSAVPDGSGSFKYSISNAKRPDGTPVSGSELRCVQCIGLLGVLNDTLIASDPGLPLVDGSTFKTAADTPNIRWVYPRYGISSALMPMTLFDTGSGPEQPSYWNNVSVRMGSLRTDGAFLTSPGVSGNTSTLKYLFGNNKANFKPDPDTGNCVTMWAKTTWHHDDMRNHEFFNPGNEAASGICSSYFFQKMGQYRWCTQDNSTGLGHCGNRRDLNDLLALMAYEVDGSGHGTALFGGFAGVNVPTPPPANYHDESPGFRVQPFRWSYLGYRANHETKAPYQGSIGPHGHWASSDGWQNPSAINQQQHYIRPFIDTQMYPELQANWAAANPNGSKMSWCYTGCCPWGTNPHIDTVGNLGPVGTGGRYGVGQDVKWIWADPSGKNVAGGLKSFGMNNLNFGNPDYAQSFDPKNWPNGTASLLWHYHQMPEDGTYAVIDELKISNRDKVMVDGAPDWNTDRVVREMQTSRYYMPPNPGTRQAPSAGGPPEFFSQTLIQSLKGFDKLKDTQNVAVVRVSWNVFTPRFMCEYKTPGTFSRTEYVTPLAGAAQAQVSVTFKGPFDYVKYNDDVYNTDPDIKNRAYSVSRPAPWEYPVGMVQSGRGVEVELISVDAPATQATLEAAPKLDGKTFTDPAALNALGKPDAPVYCLTSKLRYRLRFMYPVDQLVDSGGGKFIDPAQHYLLDTPVFDDISVTYMTAPRILAYRELSE
jgi:hypothetical protein